MALADRRAEVQTKKGPTCTVCQILTTLNKADAGTLREWLDDPTMFGSEIARALAIEGHPVRATTVQRHRAGHPG